MRKKIVLICVPAARGHVQRALLVTRGLVAAGAEVYAFCSRDFCDDFRAEGAEFRDLYEGRPLDLADSTSMPIPSRFVTFAAVYGESLTRDIAKLKPSLIVHGTFAVVALVVARQLGLPRVAICSGHNQSPRVAIPPMALDARVATSAACHSAVNVLRDRFGIPSASPFSYLDSLSDILNIIPEPPEFLCDDEILEFGSHAFFGCVDPLRYKQLGARISNIPSSQTNVFVSFGTNSYRYYAANIERMLASVVTAAEGMPNCKFNITLGGAMLQVSQSLPANVRINSFVNQLAVLAESNIFLTHNGLNSTHESVFLHKPMISYPLFADQPLLAKRCEELGLAVPLAEGLRAPVTPQQVCEAIERVANNRAKMHSRLEIARAWEDRVIASRPAVIQRILALA